MTPLPTLSESCRSPICSLAAIIEGEGSRKSCSLLLFECICGAGSSAPRSRDKLAHSFARQLPALRPALRSIQPTSPQDLLHRLRGGIYNDVGLGSRQAKRRSEAEDVSLRHGATDYALL